MALKLEVIGGVDLFATKSDTIVIPVNCVGAMGAGLARDFAIRFPHVYIQYHKSCVMRNILPGCAYAYRLDDGSGRRAYLVSTKRHWKEPSTTSMVESCAKSIKKMLEERIADDPHSSIDIAIPALGCGCGGLEWETVRKIIVRVFSNWNPETNVRVRVLGPYDPTLSIPQPL